MVVPRLVLRTTCMDSGGVDIDGDDDGDGGAGRNNVVMEADVDWKRLFYFEQRRQRRRSEDRGVVEVGVDGILNEGI